MNLTKVLLNIAVQFCKSTLHNKSAFFFILLIIIIFSSDSFSQNNFFSSDKNSPYFYENSHFRINQKFETNETDFSRFKYSGESEIPVLKKKELINSLICLDTAKKPKDTVIVFKMKKNPWKAVLYSAILPGLGQFYNESYWKIPVVVGIGGYLGYVIVKNHTDYLNYRDLYAESQTPQNPDGDLRLKSFREFYRDQRDQFLLYFTFFYVITAVDAYVDANLYDFDVSDYMRLSVFKKYSILSLNIGF